MIPKIAAQVERDWQKELASSFVSPEELLKYLQLNLDEFTQDVKARRLFPMRVPLPFVQRMVKGNASDPLFKQVFTMSDEFAEAPGFTSDPLQEHDNDVEGLLHKYESRALLIVRGGCAVNCRYCFRRDFPYAGNSLNKVGWLKVLDYLKQSVKINEVILSGGDPLMAKDDFLSWLVEQIASIPSISRIRIHTRLPIVIPSRITSELLDWFTGSRLKPIMVLHINHANEIDESVREKMTQLRQAGVTLLNQAVLLKGINDDVTSQTELSESLFDAGILPYYLHMLDKVRGASHFDVEENEAKAIVGELIKRLPGFLVPKLVREVGGQPGKTPIDLNLFP
jgi:EF-P beta-lysylation protein EpmB